ncbi:MAG TPA: hypothetical protein VFZ91_11775 [Allosphingosinicella sp.]
MLLATAGADRNSVCAYDQAAFSRLDQQTFDQDVNEGWRRLEACGCYEAAADSIAAYRQARKLESTSLYFHEAQMRAYAGDYDTARKLLARARHRTDDLGWNSYVDATAAFLSRDLAGLRAAREQLRRTPTPDSHPWFDEDGKHIPPPPWTRGDPWPPNLPVVDALIRCFDRSYREAYASPACAAGG